MESTISNATISATTTSVDETPYNRKKRIYQEALDKLDYVQLDTARKLLNKAVKYFCLDRVDKLKLLLEQNDTNDSTLHDMVAKLALKAANKTLFNLTDHHPRMILSELAIHEELFPRLLQWYFENDYEDRNGVPSYVWEHCTLANAKLLSFFTGDAPGDYVLKERGLAWQQYFKYIPSTNESEVEVVEEDEEDEDEQPDHVEDVRLRPPILIPPTNNSVTSSPVSLLVPPSSTPQTQPFTLLPANLLNFSNPGPPSQATLDQAAAQHPVLAQYQIPAQCTIPPPIPPAPGFSFAGLNFNGSTEELRAILEKIRLSTNCTTNFSSYIDEAPEQRKREVRAFLRYRNVRRWESKRENGIMVGITHRLFEEWLILPEERKDYWLHDQESDPFAED